MPSPGFPEISIIIPARDEEGNVEPLTQEISRVFAGVSHEVVWVDDGSVDGTWAEVEFAAGRYPGVRGLRLGDRLGKTAAMGAGIRGTGADILGFLDGDQQNPPADLRRLFDTLKGQPGLAMIQGCRLKRRDGVARGVAAGVGRGFRKLCLGDTFYDSGCGLRVIRRLAACGLPLQFEGMHRFLPVLVQMTGKQVREEDVGHRARAAGHSKYGVGPVRRGLCGLADLAAVRWMIWRFRNLEPGS